MAGYESFVGSSVRFMIISGSMTSMVLLYKDVFFIFFLWLCEEIVKIYILFLFLYVSTIGFIWRIIISVACMFTNVIGFDV